MAAERTGLVLAGGGARGAYEAGVLSVLLPVLEGRRERPSTLVGTSVGAINVAMVAAEQHLDAETTARELLSRWRSVTKDRVVRSILLRQMPLNALRYGAGLLSVPGVKLAGLLDPLPLADSLSGWLDLAQLHRNADDGLVETIAVVATAARTGRSVAFCEGALDPHLHSSHVIDYVSARLEVDHVRASAAIPILFPPVRVEHPHDVRGWYMDGGTRLNTPIKPALDLGAERLVVVGTGSIEEPVDDPGRHECDPPELGDAALHLLNGALVDPLIEDLRMLGNVNAFFATGARGAARYREARGKPPYRTVPYLFVGPARATAIGDLALEVVRSRYRGLRSLRSPDFAVLVRLLGGQSPATGELLSYLLFDPEFIEELIEMGAGDARRALTGAESGDPWRTGPLEGFVGATTGS